MGAARIKLGNMKFIKALYQFARMVNTIHALVTPGRTGKRLKNIAVGRTLGRLGFWKIWK